MGAEEIETPTIADPTLPPDGETVSFTRDNPEWENRLIELIHQRNDPELVSFTADLYPADIAHLIDRLSTEEGFYLFQLLKTESQGEVILELEEITRDKFLNLLSSHDLALIIKEQESDDAVDLLGDLELNRISEILSNLPLEDRINVTELLSYPEYTAGALMSKEFVTVQEKDTIKKAIQTIRKISKETDDIHTVFVTDDEGRYRGHIHLSQIILAKPATRIKRIMETELLPIPVEMDQEEVANFFTRYDFITVPVVDSRGVMLGRITVDDILEVMQEEASEDILRMGGVGGDETLATPIVRASRGRILWLVVNLATAFLAAFVVRLFENTISQIVVLAALMPIVAGMGGNAATQTMAFIIRNLALGELTFANAYKVLRREGFLGVLNGVSLGVIAGVIVAAMTGKTLLGLIIGLAMLCNMFMAAVAGTAIPLFLKKIRIDPAIASGIFVTTITDVVGFSSFLGFATLMLKFIKV